MKILILGALEKEISVLKKLINAEQKDNFCFAKLNGNEIFIALTGLEKINK